MIKSELQEALKSLSKKTNEEWVASLDERKINELEFHDRYRDIKTAENIDRDTYQRLYGNKKFYKAVQLSKDYTDNWIKKFSGQKVFLDYACGNGSSAILAAKSGAELAIGIDLSQVSIENAKKIAKDEDCSGNTFFAQGDCENTGLPDDCVDVCICSGMLHHLDLGNAFRELRRILRKDGVILVVEALDYNPIIKLYRNNTPGLRTDWERHHILSYKDVDFARKFFEVSELRHWHLFSIIGTYMPGAIPFFNSIDSVVLKIPFVKLMSWMLSFKLRKKEK